MFNIHVENIELKILYSNQLQNTPIYVLSWSTFFIDIPLLFKDILPVTILIIFLCSIFIELTIYLLIF